MRGAWRQLERSRAAPPQYMLWGGEGEGEIAGRVRLTEGASALTLIYVKLDKLPESNKRP